MESDKVVDNQGEEPLIPLHVVFACIIGREGLFHNCNKRGVSPCCIKAGRVIVKVYLLYIIRHWLNITTVDKMNVYKGCSTHPPLKSLMVKGRIPTPYTTVNCKLYLKTVFKAVLLSGGRRGESLC